MRAVNENRHAGTGVPAPGADPRRDIRRASVFGIATIATLFATVGLWAATAPLAGAVIASGKVVVESNVRRIQHPSGGVVSEIRVKDGDIVRAGDVLIRLDETNAKASLALIEIELLRLHARKARLEAERDGLMVLEFPEVLRDRSEEKAVVDAVRSEARLFETRRAAAEVQRSQFRERIDQSNEEIAGLAAQIAARQQQTVLIGQELASVQKLFDNDLVALPRLTSLQREASRLDGEAGSLVADTARARGRIAEIELQIIQIDEDLRREVSTELRDVEGKIADLSERRIAARDQLDRIEMRAPQDGIVHQQTVHTIGGVIGPAEQIMLIIPETDGLVVEARVEPAMIDRLHVGQKAIVLFPAFDSTTTPDLEGNVMHVSADSSTDQQTGASYYTVRVSLAQEQVRRLDGKELLPGMPAEVFIQTGSRTALAYLMKPFEDQLARAFRYD